MGDIVHEVERARGRRRERDHAARPERQLVRPRPRRRAVAPAVRRPAARGRRGRRHPPRPVHVAAPEGPAPRDDRRDGRVRQRVRAPAPPAAVGERPHARAHAPRLHRRALPRSGSTPARRGDPRPRGHHRHHRRLPRRDRRRLRRARSRSSTRPRYDAAYTFVFSPRPGTAGGRDDRRLRRARGRAGAHRPPRRRRRAPRAATRHEARVGRVEEVLVDGPSKKDPTRWSRAAPARTSSCTSPADRAARPPRPASYVDVRITDAAPHWLRGRARRRRRAARRAAGRASRSPPADAAARRSPTPSRTSRSSARPRRASPTLGARASRARSVTSRSCRSTRCRCTAGMDVGTAKPTAAERAAVAAPPDRRRRPVRGLVGRPLPGRGPRRGRRHRGARPPGAARRRHRPLRAGRRRRPRASPARTSTLRAELEARDRRARRARRRVRRARARRPGRRGRGSTRTTSAASCARSRSSELTGRPFSSFGPGVAAFGATVFPVRPGRRLAAPGGAARSGSTPRVAAMRGAGPASTRSPRWRRPAAGLSRTARQAIGYKEVLAHLDGDEPSLDAALDAAVRRTRAFARRQRMWFRRDPRITWFGAAANPDAPRCPHSWHVWSR